MTNKLSVLFLCTGNSCRSQMAEGLSRHFKDSEIEAYSSGIETHGLNPSAVKVMAEMGIDISNHHSKTADELTNKKFDFIVTVCAHANESCPDFGKDSRIIHHEFDDPPKLAMNASNEEDALIHYRRVRDEIKDYILTLPEALVM